MKHPQNLRWPVLTALALSATLAACGRQQDDELAAPRMDGPVAESNRGAKDADPREARQATVDSQMSAQQAAETTARVSSDMAITAKVNAALVADDELKAMQINVNTHDGQVTLTGKAPDPNARERATMLASNVDGVKIVNNQLVVTSAS